jgi:hypothetical protein
MKRFVLVTAMTLVLGSVAHAEFRQLELTVFGMD